MTSTLWITGVAGFSGRHVVEHLTALTSRPRLVGLDVTSPAPRLPLERFRRVDLTAPGDVEKVARTDPPDLVLHLAARTPPASESEMWQANVVATEGLLLGLAAAGCRQTRVLGIGSAAEYDLSVAGPLTERSPIGPATTYGHTKLAQTMLTLGLGRALGLHPIIARPFNLIGPGLSGRFLVGRLCHEFRRVGPRGRIAMGNLDTSRDLVDVRDAADAYWRLLTTGRGGEIYNLCSGTSVPTRDIVELLSELSGKHPVVTATRRRRRRLDPPDVRGNPRKLLRRTGWSPRITLRRTITDMLAAVG